MHTCPHPESDVTLNCFFSKLSFVHELVFNLAMISYFNIFYQESIKYFGA